jgi:hypothetical protein
MTKKVSLNVFVSPDIRRFIKLVAAQKNITMQAFMEQIIVEWQKNSGIKNID